jgi:hypothetical protein
VTYGVPGLEHAPLAAVAADHPRDLDHAAVVPRRGAELARPLAAAPRPLAVRDRVVERPHPLELVAPHELLEERRARERAVAELRQQPLPRLRLGLATQRELEGERGELVVGDRGDVEVRLEPLVH